MPQGQIIKGIGGFYYVRYENEIIECKARGKFRNQGIVPLVGDNVEIDITQVGKGVINEIHDRKNSIIRPPVANIDQIILVFSSVHPAPNLILIDKIIAFFESIEIELVICINKIDLDEEQKYLEYKKTYENLGYKVITTSAKKDLDIDKIKELLKGKVSALAGSSGVGKSTLLGIIINNNTVKTGELSKKIERGKHTTRHVELFELQGGGFILDTPGFSLIDLCQLKKEDLKYCFIEFEKFDDKCRFQGCNHINEPDCAVKDAVEKNIIDSGRYQRYKIIYDELKSGTYR